jgi:hypothetical protein
MVAKGHLAKTEMVGNLFILQFLFDQRDCLALTRAEMDDRYGLRALRNDWCSRQAEAILTTLRDMSILVIVLIGWALNQNEYEGDHSQRPSTDFDLLVKPRDATQVTAVLHKLNYRDGDFEPWPSYFRWFKNRCHTYHRKPILITSEPPGQTLTQTNWGQRPGWHSPRWRLRASSYHGTDEP